MAGLTFARPADDLQLGVAALGAEELAAGREGAAVRRTEGLTGPAAALHVALLVLVHPQELRRRRGDEERRRQGGGGGGGEEERRRRRRR